MFHTVAILSSTPDFSDLGLPVPVLTGSLEQLGQQARRLGLDGLEFMPDPENMPSSADVIRSLKPSGIRVSQVGTTRMALQGYGLLNADPAIREESARQFKAMIRLAGELGSSVGLGSARGLQGTAISREQAAAMLEDTLGDLAEDAEEHGTQILLEPVPLNLIAGVGTMKDAACLVRELNHPAIALMLDTAQLRTETSIFDAILEAKGIASYIQLFDNDYWPPGVLPKEESMDWDLVGTALRCIDFQGVATILPAKTGDVSASTETSATFVRTVLGRESS